MLSMHLVPSSSCLHYAHLDPPTVDISAAVDYAKWHPSSLQLLVCCVRGLLRTYWRRQVQIEGETMLQQLDCLEARQESH